MPARIFKTLWYLLTVVLCVAPYVERTNGTTVAHQAIYGSGWFIALWAVCICSGLFITLRENTRKQKCVFCLHLTFLGLLVGALFSFFNTETTLTIGRIATYISFGWFIIFYILFLCKKDGPFRELLRKLSAFIFFITLSIISLHAQKTITEAESEEIGRIVVIQGGQQTTFAMLCDDWLHRLYGAERYNGFNAVQVAVGWQKFPEEWMGERFIRIADQSERELVGVGKHACPADFFTQDGYYRFDNQHFDKTPKFEMQLALLQEMRAGMPIVVKAVQDTGRMENEIRYLHLRRWISSGFGNLALAFLSFLIFFKNGTIRNGSAHRRSNNIFLEKTTHVAAYIDAVIMLMHWLFRWYLGGHVPLGNGYDTLLFLAFLILLLTIILWKRSGLIAFAGFLMAGLSLLVMRFSFNNPAVTALPIALDTPLLSVHVSLLMAAYACLTLTFIFAIISTIYILFSKDYEIINSLTDLSRLLLYPAIGLLSAGIMLGSVWGQIAWGSHWSWDAKEVWALVTFLVYAPAVQHQFFTHFEKPVFYHIYLVLAFAFLLMTYFGVNLFFGGMHSYQ